jgi:tetratricopeptide (TPR) repeat protein
MAAIEAGQAAGGDSRGMQSAALLIVRKGGGYAGYNDRYCDLRVDDAKDPIAELRRIYNIWKPGALVTEGYTRVEKKEYERAYALGREAISLRPDSGEPRYHVACYYSRGGNAEKALQMLGEALERDPSLAKQAATDTDSAQDRRALPGAADEGAEARREETVARLRPGNGRGSATRGFAR